LAKRFKDFNESLILKSKVLMEEEEIFRQREEQLMEEHRIADCAERRKRIEKTLQKMALRRKKRLEEHRNERALLRSLRKKKLY
jgi:hypothetical protein